MQNLARHIDRDNPQVDPEVQAAVRAELEAAGCAYEDHDFLLRQCGEVPTSIIGVQSRWSFRRAWYYWVAEGPGIPPDIAEKFHQTWGGEVRTAGFAGGISPLKWCEGFAVDSYHIDSQDGLNAFVALLKSIHRPQPKG